MLGCATYTYLKEHTVTVQLGGVVGMFFWWLVTKYDGRQNSRLKTAVPYYERPTAEEAEQTPILAQYAGLDTRGK
jgi:hypothetical protein